MTLKVIHKFVRCSAVFMCLHGNCPAQTGRTLSEAIRSVISKSIGTETHFVSTGDVKIKQGERTEDAADKPRELLRDYLTDRSIERQIKEKEKTIERSLEGKTGGLVVEVRIFDAGDAFEPPNVIIVGMGPTPVEAVDRALFEPGLYAADPSKSLFDPNKSYLQWATLVNGKVKFQNLLPGVLVAGNTEDVHNAALRAEQMRLAAQAEVGRKAAAEAAANAAKRPQGGGAPQDNSSGGSPGGGSPIDHNQSIGGSMGSGGGGEGSAGGGNGSSGGGSGGGSQGGNSSGPQGPLGPIAVGPAHTFPLMAIGKTGAKKVAVREKPAKIPNLDWGIAGTRVWTDFDGDGLPDFCRLTGRGTRVTSFISCTLATGRDIAHFYDGQTLQMNVGVWGTSRAWVDANGDHAVDYCRVLPSRGSRFKGVIACTLSKGKAKGFGETIVSAPGRNIDLGLLSGRAWVDFNGDGKADFCTISRNLRGEKNLVCWLSQGDKFFPTPVISGPVNWSDSPASRVWIDVNFDGKVDFCTLSGDNDKFIDCTLSDGDKFGKTFSDLVKH